MRKLCMVAGIVCILTMIGCEKNKPRSSVRILILGNSITQHGPWAPIGWSGNWGMAASSLDKDFVHVLMDTIKKFRPAVAVDFRAKNIADWEHDFSYDFSKEPGLQEIINQPYLPDILIIRLGENVTEDYARANNYEGALEKLVTKFKGPESMVLVTGNFWSSSLKDSIQQKLALDNHYTFVSLAGAGTDENKAIDQYEPGSGVGLHPNDKGMNEIATRIWMQLKTWF